MTLPLIPVAKPDLTEAEAEAVVKVLRSGWITQGRVVQEFECKLSEYTGAKHAICVSSCTTGLFLAFRALGIQPGDEVIVPSYSFIATANSVVHAGGTPVFADISLKDFNLAVESTRAAISPKTKAILLVHQGGMPADIDAFRALAREKGLALVEDAACAIGSTYKGAPIGSHSDIVVLSFHPRKVLTTGEGGAILYNGTDPRMLQYFDIARRHGMSLSDLDRHKSDKILTETYSVIGYNFRMTDIQAAIGLVQLSRLNDMLAKRRAHVELYQSAFKSVRGLRISQDPEFGRANFQTCLLTVGPQARVSAKELMDHLAEKKIITRRGIMSAHEEPCYRAMPQTLRVPLPNTELAVRENIVLPLYSEMTESDCSRVIETILKYA